TAAKVRSFDKPEALLQYLKTLDTEIPERPKFPPRHLWHHRSRNERRPPRRFTTSNESWKYKQEARPASQGTQQNKALQRSTRMWSATHVIRRVTYPIPAPTRNNKLRKRRSKVEQLALEIKTYKQQNLQGYGNGIVKTLGVINFSLCVNKIVIDTEMFVVPDQVQTVCYYWSALY
ncbi:hypothetical protein CBL_21362, partial [Carabus blaptoides fortunei]